MFCSSLRKRQEWATLPSTLVMEKMPKWREGAINTHDLSLPIPVSKEGEHGVCRMLLLSPSDMEPPANASARIERLYHQTGGRNVGIIFLLHEKKDNDNGMKEFMKLRISLMSTFQIPILPLTSVSQLIAMVQSFQRQLCIIPSSSKRVDAQYELLPFCNVGKAMTEHTRNILSDISHSIPELAHTATTPDGQDRLREWLSEPEPNPDVAGDVIDFMNSGSKNISSSDIPPMRAIYLPKLSSSDGGLMERFEKRRV
ncbi:hypothetical protein SBOR_0348 [Sclerotinia borealis F-4128]|uniref:Uncharacterized protein n=1 Tax=Sclerotinia borealis (strain F-4128) TaxID=1432307 RepID=W9CR95_SCLBF|nr:hypothetical protein SBOR_0348 [Sclerotinia borealis F-4128]